MKIKSTPLCSFCNQENESILHLLYECRHIKEMLEKLIEWLNTNTNNNILLNKADYILGSHDQYALNMIYLFTKTYVALGNTNVYLTTDFEFSPFFLQFPFFAKINFE